jgi:Na+/H+-dicarboxylate symporter
MIQQRMAAAMALVAFALCLVIGGIAADNSFGVAVGRALVAMIGTYIVALIIGLMARRMIEENIAANMQRRAGAALTKSPEKSEVKRS